MTDICMDRKTLTIFDVEARVRVPKPSAADYDDVINWMAENMQGKFALAQSAVFYTGIFEKEEDAVLFKLAW